MQRLLLGAPRREPDASRRHAKEMTEHVLVRSQGGVWGRGLSHDSIRASAHESPDMVP